MLNWWNRMAFRVLALIVLVALAPLLLFGFVALRYATEPLTDEVQRANLQVAQLAVTLLEDDIESVRDRLDTVIQAGDFYEMDLERQDKVLSTLHRDLPNVQTLSVLDSAGQEVLKESPLEVFTGDDLLSQSHTPAFQAARAGDYYVGPIMTLADGAPGLDLAVPIESQAGDAVVGVIVAQVSLRSLLDDVTNLEIGRSGYAFVVDDEGHLIAHPDPSLVLAHADFSANPSVRSFLNREQGHVGSHLSHGGVDVIGAHARSEELNWAVVVEVPTAQALASIADIRRVLFVTLGGVALLLAATGIFLSLRIARPLTQLTRTTEAIAQGDLSQQARVGSRDEIGLLAQSFNVMTRQLRESLATLEQRVAERTRALETSAEVSRRLSTILDQEQLLSSVVQQVQEAFGYYFVQVCLVEQTSGDLVLAAGTGAVGAALLAEGNRVPHGKGLMGRAAVANSVVLVPDVSRDEGWLPHPLLPNTQAEVAVPIALGERVLGVLDVQQDKAGSLGEGDADLLHSIAGQVAIALQNIRLLAEAQQRAEHEALINQITQRIQNTGTVHSALQAAIRELGRALRARHTWARLRVAPESQGLLSQGWRACLEAQAELSAGLLYDLYEIKPLEDLDDEEAALVQELEVRGESIGQLGIGGVEMLGAETRALLAAVAERLSAHVENLRLLEETEQRGRQLHERSQELEASQRVTFASTETTEPDKLLNLVVNLIRDQFDLYHAQVYLVDEEKQAAVLYKSTGYAGRQLLEQGHQIPLERPSLVTKTIRLGQPVLVEDVNQDENWLSNPLLPHTRSELVLPLKASKGLIGALDVQSREPGRFGPSTVALFQTMTEQVAMSFENIDLLARTTRQTQELLRFTTQLRAAAEIAARLNAIHDPRQLIQEIVTLIQSRFGLYHAHVYLLETPPQSPPTGGTEGGMLVVSAGSGEVGRVLVERKHSIPLNMEKSLVARAARERKARVVNDTSTVSDFVPNPLLPQTRSEIAIPLVAGDEVLGVLDVQDDRPDSFSQADVDTLSTLAGQIAISLQNAALFAAQKRAEQTLRESEALLAGIIDNTTAVIYVKDTDGRYLLVNRQFETLFDVRREEIVGQTDHDVFSGDLADAFRENDLRVLRARQAQESEELAPHEDGLHTYVSIKFPLLDVAGKPYAVAGISTDITQRARAEAEQERFTAQLHAVADLSEHINALLDPDQILHEVTTQLRDRLGFAHVHAYLLETPPQSPPTGGTEGGVLVMRASSGEIGRQMIEQGYRFALDRQGSPVARAARQREIVLVADARAEADFVPNPLLPDTRSIVAVPLVSGDQTLGVFNLQDDRPNLFTPSDVDVLSTLAGQVATALQNAAFVKEIQSTARSLHELNRLKDTFMSSMSHELRTPLNSIIGFSEVLLMGISGDLSAEAQADVQAIFDNGRHLLGIINDLLDLAKIESGTLELYLEPIEIAALFEDVRANSAGLLVDKPVEILIQLQDDLPALQADPIRINQILNNLVSNAAKFTDEGSITLCAYRDDDQICLEVQDTGVGINEDDLERVFERFQQTDQDHARSARGTGLGLDITRQLVELHGGKIKVRSELGKGSIFSVYLKSC